MELVANLWPVIDLRTGIIQRFYARAYAMDATEEVVGATLRALSLTDFRAARMFVIPESIRIVSARGTIAGAIDSRGFQALSESIVSEALRELERELPGAFGLDVSRGGDGTPVPHAARFPASPYVCITWLMEAPDGTLTPRLGR